ncbi:hypothetical protein BSLG_009408, partial [Batrachochytrium salamandrivorans]
MTYLAPDGLDDDIDYSIDYDLDETTGSSDEDEARSLHQGSSSSSVIATMELLTHLEWIISTLWSHHLSSHGQVLPGLRPQQPPPLRNAAASPYVGRYRRALL